MDYFHLLPWTTVWATFGVLAVMAFLADKIGSEENSALSSSSASRSPIQCLECLSSLEYGRTPEECASACGMPV